VGPAAERLATARLSQIALAGLAINIALALQIGLWFWLFIRTYERAGGDKRRVFWLLCLTPLVLAYPVWWVMIGISVFDGGTAP
jgi:Na+-driven multidrug efflux pump